jgi:hypothetical protein
MKSNRVICPVEATHPATGMRRGFRTTKTEASSKQLMKDSPAQVRGSSVLTAQERAILAALCSVVIPSDELGPGAREARVAEALEAKMASQPQLRALYSPGLRSFDAWARHSYRSEFSALPYGQQVQLATRVDEVVHDWSRNLSVPGKVFRKLRTLLQKRRGLTAAVELFPRLVRDAKEAFYTSPVAWKWLEYEGPPMPEGYVNRPWPLSSQTKSNV